MTEPQGVLAEVQALVTAEPIAVDDVLGTVGWLQRLCRAASHALPATGVGVSVMTDSGGGGMAAASDQKSERIEELQFTLGEGPCMEAYQSGRPVLTVDLLDEEATRWPMYAPAARDQGVHAVFAFPMQVGAARLGVLDVYRDRPGALTKRALSQALTFAEVARMSLLDGLEQTTDTGPEPALDDLLENRSEVHQAQGMVMVALGVTLEVAMVRLRGYAFAHDCRLGDVARDVVRRKLRLDHDNHEDPPTRDDSGGN